MVSLVQVSLQCAVESKIIVGIGHELDKRLVIRVLLKSVGTAEVKAVQLLLVQPVLGIRCCQEGEVLAAGGRLSLYISGGLYEVALDIMITYGRTEYKPVSGLEEEREVEHRDIAHVEDSVPDAPLSRCQKPDLLGLEPSHPRDRKS